MIWIKALWGCELRVKRFGVWVSKRAKSVSHFTAYLLFLLSFACLYFYTLRMAYLSGACVSSFLCVYSLCMLVLHRCTSFVCALSWVKVVPQCSCSVKPGSLA